ncbi:ACP S-malonyltransferase [Kroppenstedtia pulmonis]|uniref:[acyl-carrier-protein] S-malonyltransferase n=1 Tax=Kroppenstedtia pulmonis TaxID=1380685 RepID=A0A7D3Y4Y0_9BACL|nr:ACP S-malonyltransferase [Kroppenstedtia pulmonis]QKG84485.1 ACP S-malonyltransferase [Kroppenstedtia pulmonis]
MNEVMDLAGTAVLFPPFLVNIQPGRYRDLYNRYPRIRERFEEASQALGVDLVASFFSENEEEVNYGPYARPSVIALCTGIYETVKEFTPEPDYHLGLSLGQIAAAQASGCFSFADGVKMVHTMAKIENDAFYGSDYGVYFYYNIDSQWMLKTMEELTDSGHYVKPCAYMADSQMLVTGKLSALEILNQKVSQKGGLGIVNPNSFPAHCPLMQGVKETFRDKFMSSLHMHDPEVPLMCNFTSEILVKKEEVRYGLIEQYTSVVLWAQSIEGLHQRGVEELIVIGPGNMVYKSLSYLPYSFRVKPFTGLEHLEAVTAG